MGKGGGTWYNCSPLFFCDLYSVSRFTPEEALRVNVVCSITHYSEKKGQSFQLASDKFTKMVATQALKTFTINCALHTRTKLAVSIHADGPQMVPFLMHSWSGVIS